MEFTFHNLTFAIAAAAVAVATVTRAALALLGIQLLADGMEGILQFIR